MTIPNLPTDNLYKFVALSGIAIMIFSVYIYVVHYSRLINDLDQIGLGQLKIDYRISQEKRKISLLNLEDSLERSFLSSLDTQGIKAQKIGIRFSQNQSKEISNNLNTLQTELDSISSNHLDLKYEGILLKKRNERLLFLAIPLAIFFSLGLGMAIEGFRRWYYLVQKVIDGKMRVELKNLRKETD